MMAQYRHFLVDYLKNVLYTTKKGKKNSLIIYGGKWGSAFISISIPTSSEGDADGFLAGLAVVKFRGDVELKKQEDLRNTYIAINGYMETYYGNNELSADEFYRFVFGTGQLMSQQERDERAVGRYGAIAYSFGIDETTGKRKNKSYILTDELDGLYNVCDDNFNILSPIAYAGKNATAKNARLLFAVAVDVDGIILKNGHALGLETIFYQADGPSKRLPHPSAIVSSGSGIHVYYILEKPIKLFPHIVDQVKNFRHEITWRLWHDSISCLHDKVQYEGIFQGLRMVGSITKYGDRVRAWQTGEKVDFTYLNEFTYHENCKVIDEYKTGNTPLSVAKEKWTDWYQRRIIEKQPVKTWTCKKALYNWWLRKVVYEAEVGHRYFCMMCLAIYAIKSGVDFETLKSDMTGIAIELDKISPDKNHITQIDIDDALKAYDNSYKTFPINSIQYLTNIEIKKNKRNGRKRAVHIKMMNFIRDELNHQTNWRDGNGRKPKADVVRAWQAAHPNGKKIDCQRETGLSKPTVLKWWREVERNEEK